MNIGLQNIDKKYGTRVKKNNVLRYVQEYRKVRHFMGIVRRKFRRQPVKQVVQLRTTQQRSSRQRPGLEKLIGFPGDVYRLLLCVQLRNRF